MKIPSRLNIETVDGTELWVPADDNSACAQIRSQLRLDWDNGFRELDAIKRLPKDAVVFDVGAFVGDSTSVFVKQGCEVHAFEPRAESFMCLLQNCPKAFCYNLALGDGKNRFECSTDTENMGGKPLLPGARYSVQLDHLNVSQLDFLKIDVEGMEGCVLRGGRRTIKLFHPTIHIEFNPFVLTDFGDSQESVVGLLREFGYEQFAEVYRHEGPHGDHWDMVCI